MSLLPEIILAVVLAALLILYMNSNFSSGYEGNQTQPQLLATDDPMRITSKKQFYELVSRDQDTIIFVGASWCGYCQQAITPFMEAARGFAGKVFVLEVKGTELTRLVEDIGVKGFPSILKSHHNGTRTMYTGERSVDAFREYFREAQTNVETTR